MTKEIKKTTKEQDKLINHLYFQVFVIDPLKKIIQDLKEKQSFRRNLENEKIGDILKEEDVDYLKKQLQFFLNIAIEFYKIDGLESYKMTENDFAKLKNTTEFLKRFELILKVFS